MKDQRSSDGPTLSDILIHMQHMELRLSEDMKALKQEMGGMKQEVGSLKQEMGGMKQEVGSLKQEMGGLRLEMKSMEKRLIQRMDSLEEDLTATMKDVFLLQKHTGLRR
jgi:regulator of replication initiation timing